MTDQIKVTEPDRTGIAIVTILGKPCSMYQGTMGGVAVWRLALPPTRGSHWSAGIRDFPTREEALTFATQVQAQGIIKVQK